MPTEPIEKHEPKPFDWNTHLASDQEISLISRCGKKTHTFTVGGVGEPKMCIRGEHITACEAWYEGANMQAFALDEIPESFEYLGKEKGIHRFRQIKYPSEKKSDFFLKEAGRLPK